MTTKRGIISTAHINRLEDAAGQARTIAALYRSAEEGAPVVL